MARNNRKKVISYLLFIAHLWWQNRGFGEPIQLDSSFSKEPKTVITRGVEISRVISTPRGGDFPKSPGPGPRAKADARRNASTGTGSIIVQGFTPQSQYGSRPFNKLKPESCRNGVRLNQGQFNGHQNPDESSLSIEKMARHLCQNYREYQEKYNSPSLERFDTQEYNRTSFKELTVNPVTGERNKASCDEAITAVYSEMEGIVLNPKRIKQPICKSVDLDFVVSGPGKYSHMDVKHPVGSDILKKQGQKINIQEMAYNMGQKITKQKQSFCSFEQGPKSSKNVLHIVDLAYVPLHEKEIVKEYCLKGAGSSEGIEFVNNN